MNYQCLITEQVSEKEFSTTLQTRSTDALAEGELLISVSYSCLNYKDALSAAGNPGVTRNFPHTPGIDAVGIVQESTSEKFSKGDEVIVTGYDLGMNTDGGLAEFIRVPAAWALALPQGLSARQAMVLGTAGLTAGLCVDKLLQIGASADAGQVLVTGASGGVGSVAIALLAKLGFKVIASTGKTQQTDLLKSLGAEQVIDRSELSQAQRKPMLKPQWRYAIDTVGGETLANALKSAEHGGSVACCGLAASADLPITVLPFILRDINLLGVDSVEIPLQKKQNIWQKFSGDWQLDNLEPLTREVELAAVPELLAGFFCDPIGGRIIVKIQ